MKAAKANRTVFCSKKLLKSSKKLKRSEAAMKVVQTQSSREKEAGSRPAFGRRLPVCPSEILKTLRESHFPEIKESKYAKKSSKEMFLMFLGVPRAITTVVSRKGR